MFEVKIWGKNQYYIYYFLTDKIYFLWHDLTLRKETYECWETKFSEGFYRTKQEAQKTIELYLERENKMENYMMIEGEKIKISDETAKNLKEKFGEKYYSIGSQWQIDGGDIALLAQVLPRKVCLICITDGNRYKDPVFVENVHRIPLETIKAMV